MKGLKLPVGKIPVRENKTLADGRMAPAPENVIPVADLKQRVVRGIFAKKGVVPEQKPKPVPEPIPIVPKEEVVEPVQVQAETQEQVQEVQEPVKPVTRRLIIKRKDIKDEVKDLAQKTEPLEQELAQEQAQPAEPAEPIKKKVVLKRPIKDEIVNLTKPASCDSIPISPAHKKYADNIIALEKDTKYKVPKGTTYQPLNRIFFNRLIPTIYKDYIIKSRKKTDYEACRKMTIQTNTYQEFIREYMRLEAPSRGILVYHGLGSGKTCSAIGAAEALYGSAEGASASAGPRKIIVLTPTSLQENFINEVSFCGFRHYRVQNHWVKFPIMRLDGTLDMGVVCLAKSVLEIPDDYIEMLKTYEDRSKAVIWVPDFDKAPNFDDFGATEQDQIKKQIRQTIKNRIEFIGYTGLTRENLLNFAINDPTHFDNAVIVIDEVHNLTRLMRGRLEKYLVPKRDKKGEITGFYEPVSTKKWEPKFPNKEKHYERGFLIYRLLAEARNSKIVALSGTPIVNYPEEVGILANILRGYFHCASLTTEALGDGQEEIIMNVLKNNERVDYYSIEKGSANNTTIFFTLLEPGFKKVAESSSSLGENDEGNVVYDGQISTIEDVAGKVRMELAAQRVVIKNEPKFEALPLYPVSSKDFTGHFIEDKGEPHMINSFLFAKRMSGIISYYKGGRKDYMPMVNRDIVVDVPMSAHMIGPYSKARSGERDGKGGDETGKVATTETVNWGVISGLPEDSNKNSAANYRFRSRAMCNFVFPNGIARPFPTDAKQAVKEAAISEPVYGDKSEEAALPLEEAVEKQRMLEADLAKIETEAEEAVAETVVQAQPAAQDDGIVGEEISEEEKARLLKMPYDERIRYTVDKLYRNRAQYFNMEAADPKNRLDTYSPKFARIIENISTAPGSSLVYSQFKTLEGIGILGIAMKTNGYEEVRIVMEGDKMKFHPDTEASFKQRPDQPRYMVFSGDEPVIVRQALINIFNMNWDAGLTKELKAVLGPLDKLRASGNKKGEVCRVFMITGAGAEGLSLKNVRAVHIMEPYWNKVRLDQVKGRAVRICSHKDLLRKDRNVDIFTYVSTIEKSMLSLATEIEYMDGGKTTDEYIYNMSLLKEKVNLEFLDTLQQMAVDCELNKVENNMYRCFDIEGTMENKFLYDPRLNKDIEYSAQTFKETVEDPMNPGKQISKPITEIPRRIIEKLPQSILEGQDEALLEKVGERGLIYTEMIDKDGEHYFGIFTDEELTHPLPFDSARELGIYDTDPKTGGISFYE